MISITFSNEDAETFMFGCDSGQLYKGSLGSVASVQSRKFAVRCIRTAVTRACFTTGEEGLADMTVQPKNPITMTYQSHDSPVYSVSFSPFHRHVFLSGAHDGQVRLYSQLFVSELGSSTLPIVNFSLA